MKESDRTQWHQLATEIFYTYINKPNGAIKVRKTGLKRIEEFLLGDATPYVFYEIQVMLIVTILPNEILYKILKEKEKKNLYNRYRKKKLQTDVLKTLEEKYFSTFLSSDQCRRMLNEARENGIVFADMSNAEIRWDLNQF